MRISGNELFWVFLIVLLLFGSRRLPDLARSLGRSLKELRKASDADADPGDDDEASSTRPDGSDGTA